MSTADPAACVPVGPRAVASPPPSFDGDSLDGRDPELLRALMPWIDRFTRYYIRLDCDGREHIRRGPVMYVGNHNNGFSGPDVLATLSTLWNELGVEAPVYGLAHDFAMRHVPAFGRVVQWFGGVRACRTNARRIFEERRGAALVYPGGVPEAFRPTRRRDRVDFGSRTGFLAVARDTGTPIVPVVAHGAHRSAFIFTDGVTLARVLRLRRFRQQACPIAMALPWGLVVGPFLPYLPLPFRVRLRLLPPFVVRRDQDLLETQRRLVANMQQALDELAGVAA